MPTATGFFYMLDRTNGQFLWAKPFVRTNWYKGFDKNGRPHNRSRHDCHLQGQ